VAQIKCSMFPLIKMHKCLVRRGNTLPRYGHVVRVLVDPDETEAFIDAGHPMVPDTPTCVPNAFLSPHSTPRVESCAFAAIMARCPLVKCRLAMLTDRAYDAASVPS